MSMHHIEKLTCPKCNAEIEFLMHDTVNVTLNPENKAKILDRSLFRTECPGCGVAINVEYPILYHDMKQQIMIQVCKDPKTAASSPRLDMQIEGFPPLDAGYRVRTVVGTDRLRERIRIFDAGLDDVAIEVCKAFILRHIKEEKFLFFDYLEDENIYFQAVFEDGSCRGFSVSFDAYKDCKKIADELMEKKPMQFFDAVMFLSSLES